MSESNVSHKFAQVVQRMDPHAKLLRAWPLTGGVSAQVTALEIERADDQAQKLILRRHGAVDLSQNPHIAADEFKLLQLVRGAGVAAPTPYHLDASGEIFPTPYLVIEHVEGQTEFAPADMADGVRQLAAHLVTIHRVDSAHFDLSFLPQQGEGFGERPATPDESLDEGRIRDVLESTAPVPQRNESVLLHGDYWPGNILWKDGQLAAVIDWEDASVGDPLSDFANSRLEILWAVGVDAMYSFTQQYRSMSTVDFTNLPYWDLCTALRPASKLSTWGLDESTERAMREGHRWFITQAIEQISGGGNP